MLTIESFKSQRIRAPALKAKRGVMGYQLSDRVGKEKDEARSIADGSGQLTTHDSRLTDFSSQGCQGLVQPRHVGWVIQPA